MSLCEEVQALCVALHEDLCAVAQAALCVVDQWDPQGVCPCVVGLKEAVVPKEVAHLVDINEADIINEVNCFIPNCLFKTRARTRTRL